jgi:hypothetical protein
MPLYDGIPEMQVAQLLEGIGYGQLVVAGEAEIGRECWRLETDCPLKVDLARQSV